MTTAALRKTRSHTVGEKDNRAVARKAEVRVVDEGKRQFTAKVLTYNEIDDYGTIWAPGCFDESLKQRMPRIAWAHSWQDPIGHYIEVVKNDERSGLVLLGQLSDFDDVPRARQCYSQMKDGTIDQFSVGFTRQQWTNVDDELRAQGAWELMQKALLDEASPVLVGAVPGTALLGVRSGGKVPIDNIVELAKKVRAGELTHEEADVALQLIAGEVPDLGSSSTLDEGTEGVDEADAEAVLEEALAELDGALTRSRR